MKAPVTVGVVEHDPKTRRGDRWAAWGLALVASAVYGVVTLNSIGRRAGDFYWGIAVGRYEAAKGLMRHDIFSYVLAGKRIVTTEWAYDLVIGWVSRGGNVAVTAWLVAVWLAGLIAATWYLRLLGARGSRLVCYMVITTWVYSGLVAQGRALGLSLIYLPLALGLLHVARTKPRWYIALVPLFVIWVNSHGSIFLGLGAVGLETVWAFVPTRLAPAWAQRASKRVVWGLAGALAGTIVSPWGPGLVLYDLKLATNGQISGFIQEWQGANLHSAMWLTAAIIVALLFVRRIRAGGGPALETSMAIAMAVGWLHAVRFAPYLTLALAAMVVSDPRPIWRGVTARRAGLVGAMALAGVVVSGTLHGVVAKAATPYQVPAKAFNYLTNVKATGRLATFYDWAGYGETRGWQSFIDGRTDLFIGSGLTQYELLDSGEGDIIGVLDKHEVTWVMWPDHTALWWRLSASPQWYKAYDSQGITLFEHVGGTQREGHIVGWAEWW